MSEDIALTGPAVRVWGLGATDLAIESPTATLAFKAGGDVSLTAKMPTLSFADNETSCNISTPAVTVEIESNYSRGGLDLEVPAPKIALIGSSNGVLSIAAPGPAVEVESTYTYGNGAIEAPSVELAFVLQSTNGDFEITVTMPVLDIETVSTFGSLAVEPNAPRLSITSLAGTVGSLALDAATAVIALSGYEHTSGGLAIETPAPIVLLIESYGSWKCLVLNTDNMALSEYANFDFVGFAKLGSQTLALSRNGSVYALGGSTDAGTAIAAEFETGLDDMKVSKSKRLMGVTFGVKSDGDGTYKSRHWDGYGSEKTVATTDSQFVESKKVKADKMRRSRVLGINYENTAGADFLVDSIEMAVKLVTKRRGND